MITADPAAHTISIHVTNLTARDAQFLGEVIALFTDPANAATLPHVRSGQLLIQADPQGRASLTSIAQALNDACKPGEN